MFKQMSLRTRILLLLVAIVVITLVGGAIMIGYTYRMETLLTRTEEMAVSASRTVETLLQALIRQKGFVSYYFMDGDPIWLERLEQYRQAFRNGLDKALAEVGNEEDRKILTRIRSEYETYVQSRDRVIEFYRAGERDKGLALHQSVRSHFHEILSLCERYKESRDHKIKSEYGRNRQQAHHLRMVSGSAVFVVVVLAVLFTLVLQTQVLDPIRRLASEAERFGGRPKPGNEVKALSRGVRGLIEDADQTHTELEKSRARLFQAEKMAMVGKLAAGVAHSIRNPMTSIKMRLFSLEHSIQLSLAQKEDFEVISEEILHIDNIVRNFLEYSRPSKLRAQKMSPSEIVDMSLRLLRHRFKSYGIEVELKRPRPLPEVRADPDQLKEVFVNILVNACEAMTDGGTVVIEEEESMAEPLGLVAVVRIRDRGPGIPQHIQEKIFEPFFSTKEEGTGLGLSIAVRIVQQHGGLLRLKSGEGEGAEFTITLPCREDKSWA